LPQLATDTATPRQQKIYSQLPVRRTDYSGSLVSTSPEGRALAYVEAALRYYFFYNRDKNRYSGEKDGQPFRAGHLVKPLE
jgi:hypothetical protein